MKESSLTNNNYNHQTMIVEMGGLSVQIAVEGLGLITMDALKQVALLEMFIRSEEDLLLL